MALKYTEETIKHFTSPKNLGDVADANAEATEGSPACGDMVKYTLKINPETLIIEDIKFRSYGCASNIATASVATEMVKGKHIDEVKKMVTGDAAEMLGGLPAVKMHCSVLAINGIKAAIREFEIKAAPGEYAIVFYGQSLMIKSREEIFKLLDEAVKDAQTVKIEAGKTETVTIKKRN